MLTKQQLTSFAENYIKVVPHSVHINLSLITIDHDGIELEMPYDDRLIGNPATGVIHSGAITTLMDSCCGLAVFTRIDNPEVCPTLDLRIDHMAAAQPGRVVRGFAEAYHITPSVIFTRGVAYHDNKDEPIAHAVGTFMRLGRSTLGKFQ